VGEAAAFVVVADSGEEDVVAGGTGISVVAAAMEDVEDMVVAAETGVMLFRISDVVDAHILFTLNLCP